MRDRDTPLNAADISSLTWSKMGGLLPAIVQDSRTGQVLMLGYMSRESLEMTLRDASVVFYSRSRGELWRKGETSGNHLTVKAIYADCDNDALLIKALPDGPTCHLGTQSCFAARKEGDWLTELANTIHERAHADPDTSYTARLLTEGTSRLAQKIGEEGVEVALAAVTRGPAGCVEEIGDLIYHLTVLMEAKGIGWNDVAAELRKRQR